MEYEKEPEIEEKKELIEELKKFDIKFSVCDIILREK